MKITIFILLLFVVSCQDIYLDNQNSKKELTLIPTNRPVIIIDSISSNSTYALYNITDNKNGIIDYAAIFTFENEYGNIKVLGIGQISCNMRQFREKQVDNSLSKYTWEAIYTDNPNNSIAIKAVYTQYCD